MGTFAKSGITGAYVTLQSVPVWFAGRIVGRVSPAYGEMGPVFPDRLGTERGAGARRKPYGEDAVTGVKFATYSKDGFSGLLYADQRWYAGGYGRFTTADRYVNGAGLSTPQGWNRYAYVLGDPGNLRDPRGTCAEDTNTVSNVCDKIDDTPVEAGGGSPDGEQHNDKNGSTGGGNARSVVGRVQSALAKAAGTQTIFTESQLDCISGIETGRTWNPDIVSSSGRVGLFQFNETSWTYARTSIPWDGGSAAKDPYTAGLVALVLLTNNLKYSGVANPTADAVQGAIDRFGEHDGRYGAAVIECAKDLDAGLTGSAVNVLQAYANWKASR